MNHQFTQKLRQWLETPSENRDYAEGALMLYQLNGNSILYNNLKHHPERRASKIEYELQKYYNVRVKDFTHQEVSTMMRKAKNIAAEHGLDSDEKASSRKTPKTAPQKRMGGQRADHESLPIEIQALYETNLNIRQQMRDIHNRLRIITETVDNKVCPDSDLYPYVTKLISLDKEYHDNWNAYDSYTEGSDGTQRTYTQYENDRYYTNLVNLFKGRYRKSGDRSLGSKIKDWYNLIGSPTAKLRDEMADLGLL